MKQIVKNKNTQKTRDGAAIVDNYCEDKFTKSHENVKLTPRRAHGLTTPLNYLRDIQQLRAAYLHGRRFKTGPKLKILNEWLIITDAPGVVLPPAALLKIEEVVYGVAGPGAVGKSNEHIKQAAGEKGVVPGPDANPSLCPVRRLGPFLYRRRDQEVSEYRMHKDANEVVRLKLQKEENVYFPDTDAQREQARKKAGKLSFSEEIAADEWERIQQTIPQADGSFSLVFSHSDSRVKDVAAARKALASHGYEFTQDESSLLDTGIQNHFFRLWHPDWEVRRKQNAKKSIPANARRLEITVDLLQLLCEARQHVREYHRQHLESLNAKTASPPAEVPVAPTLPPVTPTVEMPMPAETLDVLPPRVENVFSEIPGNFAPALPLPTTEPPVPTPVPEVIPALNLSTQTAGEHPPTIKVDETTPVQPSPVAVGASPSQGIVEKNGAIPELRAILYNTDHDFDPSSFMVPTELIQAAGEQDSPLLTNGQDALGLLRKIGWALKNEQPKPNELILAHRGQVYRLRQDETLFNLQLALLRGKLRRHTLWTDTAEPKIGIGNAVTMRGDPNVYLDPFHLLLFDLELSLNDVGSQYRWIDISRRISPEADPIDAATTFCRELICPRHGVDPETALLQSALHHVANPAGVLSILRVVRRRILGTDQEMPPFASKVAPLNLPRDYETDEFFAELVKGTEEWLLAHPKSVRILRRESTPVQPSPVQGHQAKVEPLGKSAESARAKSVSVQEPRKQLTEAIVIACVVEAQPGIDLHCISDFEDLSRRLGAGGLTMKQLGDTNIEISAADSEPLVVDTTCFIVGLQRQILQHIIKSAAPQIEPATLDLELLSAAAQSSARWSLPLFGKFWVVAEKICADKAIAAKWQSSLKTSSNIANPTKRLNTIQGWMQDDKLTPFEQFVLLQSHCGSSPGISSWLIPPRIQTAPAFDAEQLGFTLTAVGKEQRDREAERALLAEQEKHKASATREGRHI